MCQLGCWEMGVYVMLMLCAYLRPGEGLKLRCGDLIAPTPERPDCWSLLLFPQERGDRSKTGALDDSILLDTPWCRWMGAALQMVAQGSSEAAVFSFDYVAFVKVFKKTSELLGLRDLVPYQARHSGPSIDRSRQLRSLDEISRRGRWQSAKSVQRYERHARLGQTLQNFSGQQRRCFDFAERHLEELLGGRVSLGALQLP